MILIGNENDSNSLLKPSVERLQDERTEYKILGSYFRTPGLSLYCYNPHKDEIELVRPVEKGDLIWVILKNGYRIDEYKRPKISVDPRWHYFEALNMVSALRKIEKFKAGKIRELFNLRMFDESKMKI